MAQAMPCFCPKLSRCLMPHPSITTLFTDTKALAWASRTEREGRQQQPQQPCSDTTIPVQTLAFWHLTNPGIKFVRLLWVSYTITMIAVASFRLWGQERDELPVWQWISSFHHLNFYQPFWPLALSASHLLSLPQCRDQGFPSPGTTLKNLLGHCYVILL